MLIKRWKDMSWRSRWHRNHIKLYVSTTVRVNSATHSRACDWATDSEKRTTALCSCGTLTEIFQNKRKKKDLSSLHVAHLYSLLASFFFLKNNLKHAVLQLWPPWCFSDLQGACSCQIGLSLNGKLKLRFRCRILTPKPLFSRSTLLMKC